MSRRDDDGNVRPLPARGRPGVGNGDNGGTGGYLRAIERRLSKLEVRFDAGMKHVATKASVLWGFIAASAFAIATTIAVFELWKG